MVSLVAGALWRCECDEFQFISGEVLFFGVSLMVVPARLMLLGRRAGLLAFMENKRAVTNGPLGTVVVNGLSGLVGLVLVLIFVFVWFRGEYVPDVVLLLGGSWWCYREFPFGLSSQIELVGDEYCQRYEQE